MADELSIVFLRENAGQRVRGRNRHPVQDRWLVLRNRSLPRTGGSLCEFSREGAKRHAGCLCTPGRQNLSDPSSEGLGGRCQQGKSRTVAKHLLRFYRSSCWSWSRESKKLEVRQSFTASVVNGRGSENLFGDRELLRCEMSTVHWRNCPSPFSSEIRGRIRTTVYRTGREENRTASSEAARFDSKSTYGERISQMLCPTAAGRAGKWLEREPTLRGRQTLQVTARSRFASRSDQFTLRRENVL